MDWRLETLDSFWIVGFSKRISLQFEGENHQLDELVGKMTPAVATHLKSINDRSPEGILNVSADFEDRTREGSMLDQFLGVASSRPQEGFACLEVPSLQWAVFTAIGPYPEALQQTWADIYGKWLAECGFCLTGGPEILRNLSTDCSAADFHSEIWIPVHAR